MGAVPYLLDTNVVLITTRARPDRLIGTTPESRNEQLASSFRRFRICEERKPANRFERSATWSEANPEGRWCSYGAAELLARDKASLDIFWLRDETLADSDNLPPPDVIAQEIVDDLEAALEQFRLISADLNEASDSVLLEAACDGQLDRAGMRNELEQVEVERLERARIALDADIRERLECEGRALNYEQVLQRVATSLTDRPSVVLTGSPIRSFQAPAKTPS